MAGLSSISGLVAGFDTKGAVDELLGVRKFEISQLKAKQDAEVARQDALLNINDGLSALRSTSIGMADASAFFGYTASLASSSASVPASTLLDVSGTNAVSAGQHAIIVQQLAQAERLSSSAAVLDGAAAAAGSDTTPLNMTGTFQINGASVSVSAADSLQDIAATINQLNTGASATGVSASVIKVSASDYRLTLAADATGSTGFTLSGADLDAAGALSGLQLGATGQANARQVLQTAQDAQVSIDGLSIVRSSNTIADALAGVTLSLKQADAAVTVNMSIGVDQTSLRDNIQSFVDAYKHVQSMINEQLQFYDDTGSSGVRAGEALLT
ncbi:MAG: flagellar filament capping protein FliD, partial [Mariprofundaceae bacterium]